MPTPCQSKHGDDHTFTAVRPVVQLVMPPPHFPLSGPRRVGRRRADRVAGTLVAPRGFRVWRRTADRSGGGGGGEGRGAGQARSPAQQTVTTQRRRGVIAAISAGIRCRCRWLDYRSGWRPTRTGFSERSLSSVR